MNAIEIKGLIKCICRPENRSCTESEPHHCRLRTEVSKCINITQHIRAYLKTQKSCII